MECNTKAQPATLARESQKQPQRPVRKTDGTCVADSVQDEFAHSRGIAAPISFSQLRILAPGERSPGTEFPCLELPGPIQRKPVIGAVSEPLESETGTIGKSVMKIAVGPPGDAYEKDADRVADNIVRPPSTGRHPGSLGRSISIPTVGTFPPPNRFLLSRPQPLESTTRHFMESHLGHDFSQVRIHADAEAAQLADSIQALAFTAGQDVVFAANRYNPATSAGTRLLAHELTHVMQQRAGHSAGIVQRRGIFETIGIFLGLTEGTFSDRELHDYLDKVTKSNKIEDRFDSDNKARAIVRKWKASAPDFNLTGIQKALLIREMDTGYVGSEDQRGILDLLEKSDDSDLRSIFNIGGIKARTLLDDFGGDSLKELSSFLEARFKGGRDAVSKGVVEPQSGPAIGAPKFSYSWTILKAKIESGATTGEILAHLASFTSDERTAAVKDLSGRRVSAQRELSDLEEQSTKESDPAKKTVLQEKANKAGALVSRMDFVIQTVSKDVALLETPASISAKTHIPTASEKTEIKKALNPDARTDSGGVPITFDSADTAKYEKKLRDYIPGMIDSYHTLMVVGKGPVEHGDPTKVHSLKELENIGNVSKRETDAVFGSYKTGPPLKADTKLKRGNIHDLWADEQKKISTLSKIQRRNKAKQLMFYFFQSDDGILEINRSLNADPKFGPSNLEAKSLEKLADDFTKTDAQVKKLNEIDRGWDATAGGGQINIQLFKKPTPEADRDFLWDMFQTLIHEYLHTLKHPKYDTFAASFGGDQSSEFNTLIEGVDSYLDEVVWSNIQPKVNDPALRAEIEGPVDSLKPPITVEPASRRRYASYNQAIKLVSIVGPANLYAAYFLGETEKIGG